MTFPTAGALASGGTDWQKKTPGFATASLAAGLQTALSINGRGILTSIVIIFAATGNVRLRITIDGTLVMDDANFMTGPSTTFPVSSTLLYGFKRSLLVESSTTGTATMKFFYSLG